MAKAQKSVAETSVEMTQIVLPQSANHYGNAFGGQIMSWIDICAAVSAQRCSRSNVITASIDAVHFIAPIHVGEVVILKSQVNAAFRTSMECGVSVIAEDPITGERRRAARAYATFVAIDSDGKPQRVPTLIHDSDESRRRQREAHERRKQRLEVREAQRRALLARA